MGHSWPRAFTSTSDADFAAVFAPELALQGSTMVSGTVSETPVVLSSRCAAARRSSSRSINRLGTGLPPIERVYANRLMSMHNPGWSVTTVTHDLRQHYVTGRF
jgi:hypothetical protein